jgi:hypothetical protein
MSANSSISISELPTSTRNGFYFVLAAMATTLLLLACAAALNWWVDPFDKLGRNQIGVYSSSERDAKPQMIIRYPHDGIILGTSRMTYVDSTMIKLTISSMPPSLPPHRRKFWISCGSLRSIKSLSSSASIS